MQRIEINLQTNAKTVIDLTQEEISALETAEAQRQAQISYQQKRVAEYPPMTNYIDGIVKGDQTQIQSYIDACLAVKAKYPKA